MTISPLLAQGIDAVPAPLIKNLLILLLAFVLGAAAVVAIVAAFWKKTRHVVGGPVRIEGEVKTRGRMPNVRQDACDFKMAEVSRRLDEHSREITNLWGQIKADNNRQALTFESIQRALGRIEGKLDSLPEVKDK